MRIGAIGIDSSHLPEFTRRIKERHDAGETPCRVTACFWTDGRHDWPERRGRRKVAVGQAVDARRRARRLARERCSNVSMACMVLAVSGDRHLELARPSLERGTPTYIDKPLACTLEDARHDPGASRPSTRPAAIQPRAFASSNELHRRPRRRGSATSSRSTPSARASSTRALRACCTMACTPSSSWTRFGARA